MNKIKYFIGSAILIFIVGIIGFSFIYPYFADATGATIQDNSDEYKISSYSVNIDVAQNNILTVTENINVYFYEESQGIYRFLPETTTVKFFNSQNELISKNYNVSYNLIDSSENSLVSSEDGFYVIKLMTSGIYYQNESRNYEIQYSVNLGNDRIPEFDQFYYNVIGQYWDTSIEDISVTINFPTEIDEQSRENAEAYAGEYGSVDAVDFEWNPAGTTLTLTYDELAYGEGITVRVFLGEGYYSAQPFDRWLNVLTLILIISLAILAFVLFKKHSNSKTIVPVVQFSVNKKFTPADVGYIMDKQVDNKDVASLIIYWAQQGYVEIVEKDKTTFIRKLKKPENMKSYEQTLFNVIFEDEKPKPKLKSEKETKGEPEFPLLEINEIGKKIALHIPAIKSEISNLNQPLFNTSAINSRMLLIILMGVMFAITGVAINLLNVIMWKVIISALLGLFVIGILYLVSRNTDTNHFMSKKDKFYAFLILALSLGLIIWFLITSFDAYCDLLLTSIWIVLELLFVGFLLFKFNVRTDEGISELGDIIGLKNFIEVAEKSRLEMLVKDNPSAFYDILPYAYVLGVYEKWCKKFEKISIETPNWYVSDSPNLFNTLIFIHIMDSSCNQILRGIDIARIANLAENAKNLTGGFGKGGGFGGGFTGGGFGGGGGGRC